MQKNSAMVARVNAVERSFYSLYPRIMEILVCSDQTFIPFENWTSI